MPEGALLGGDPPFHCGTPCHARRVFPQHCFARDQRLGSLRQHFLGSLISDASLIHYLHHHPNHLVVWLTLSVCSFLLMELKISVGSPVARMELAHVCPRGLLGHA